MDNQKSQIIAMLISMALILWLLELYYFNYNYFYNINLGFKFFEERAHSLHNTFVFKHTTVSKSIVILLIVTATLLSTPKRKLTKSTKSKKSQLILSILIGLIYIFSSVLYTIIGQTNLAFIALIILNSASLIAFIAAITQYNKLLYAKLLEDRFQKNAKRFEQYKTLLENKFSVNIKTINGWINNVNPFRASMVLGTPGSGKSYSVLNEAIIQHIKKGFTMLLYDFKYPTQSTIVYNALKKHHSAYKVKPKFCVIDFDNVKNRCNPLQPDLLIDTTDATAAAQALMYGLYPKWAQKQGEFFTESSINFVAACIWALKKCMNGKYCTVPHLVQFVTLDYDKMFNILTTINDPYINNVIAPFISAYQKEAFDQLEGQIGTTRIALSRLTSKTVYWVMNPTENDPNNFSLQINDPDNPILLMLANNPDKKEVYSPLLSLYNTRIMRLINKPNMQKCAMILDELPTLSFPPGSLDNLIGTARSNKIAIWLGFQDFAQIIRDMGKEIAEVIKNTVGNIYSGMVNFDTAEQLSKMFGQIKVENKSVNLSKSDTTLNYSTKMENLIPASEISSLPNGWMVGRIADDRGYEMEQKTFYSQVLINHEERKTYEKNSIPEFQGNPNNIQNLIDENFNNIATDITELAEAYEKITKEAPTPKEEPKIVPFSKN